MIVSVTLGLLASGWLELQDPAHSGCLDAQRLEARVAAELGRDAFVPREGMRARAQVVRDRRGLVARIDLVDARDEVSGSREMVARSARCAELETALVLNLVLALSEPPAASVPERPAPDRPASSPAPVAAVATLAPRTDWQGWVGASAVTGALPGWGFGALLDGRAERGRLSLGTEGRFEGALPVDRAGVRLRSWRATGALAPCARAWIGAGCGVVRGGILRASSARSSSTPVLEVGARLTVRFLGGAAAVYLERSLALVRTRLAIDGAIAWSTPRFATAAGLMVATP